MSPDSRLKRLALGTASIFLLVVGSLLDIPQMYLMAVAVTLIPLIFWIAGFLFLRGTSCTRTLPASCRRGERVKVELLITNTTPFSKYYVRVLDALPRWVKFDGYDEGYGSIILSLLSGDSANLAYYIRPLQRGLQQIGPTKLSNPDLIGLANYSTTAGGRNSILVYPEIVPVSTQFLNGGSTTGWIDQENAATRGAGTDFQGVREYRSGDELRRVNWKTTARFGTMAVTEYALGYVNDLTIALDLSAEAYGEQGPNVDTAFETAIQIAASLAEAGLRQGGSVKFVTNGNLSGLDIPQRGADSSITVMTALALANPTTLPPLSRSLDEYRLSGDNGRALIVITALLPYDAQLSASIGSIQGINGAMSPIVFWLDQAAFRSTNPYRRSDGSSEPGRSIPRVYQNAIGKNVIVNPSTRLQDLFSRSIF